MGEEEEERRESSSVSSAGAVTQSPSSAVAALGGSGAGLGSNSGRRRGNQTAVPRAPTRMARLSSSPACSLFSLFVGGREVTLSPRRFGHTRSPERPSCMRNGAERLGEGSEGERRRRRRRDIAAEVQPAR
eukprot:scaffold20929_cov30-Tisochrysis_lutea.AAC.5